MAKLSFRAADCSAMGSVINRILVYPVAEFDGSMKTQDWKNITRFPSDASSSAETRWVFPERFFDELPAVLRDAKPLPGEQARYAEVLAVVAAAETDPKLKTAMAEEATRADKDLVDPLLQFRNFGIQLPSNWVTISNGAAFGTDYFTRTAVARSNILVNKAAETKYFYQDLDATGARLNGAKRYSVTFPVGQLPPVRGFWSLTMYDQYHFFVPNEIKRFSIGTKNKDLKPNQDGSVTIYVQATAPSDPLQLTNWLPAPNGEDFSLYIRTYWPDAPITEGTWTPPPAKLA